MQGTGDRQSPLQHPPSKTRRRGLAVVSGATSITLVGLSVVAILSVAETYGNAFDGGWAVVWIMAATVASLLGVGAVVLWNPPRPTGLRRALTWTAGAAIVVLGVVAFVIAT